jgi:hypothetical protein
MAMSEVNRPEIGPFLGHVNLMILIYLRLDVGAARGALEANAASSPLSLPVVRSVKPDASA